MFCKLFLYKKLAANECRVAGGEPMEVGSFDANYRSRVS